MNFSTISGVIAGVVFAVASSWYTVDVARKKITASVATFLMLTIINISQLVSLISKHVWHVVPFTVVGLITSILICALALRNRKIYFELPDKIGLIGATIGLALWLITKSSALNLYIVTAINLIIFAPLVIKSFKRPDLESVLPWQVNLLASFFLLLTINSRALVVWIVPVRQFLCSLALNIGLLRGEIKAKHKLF